VRISVADFQPNRAQRRIARGNAALRIIEKPADYDDEHYLLYVRYLQARHPESSMSQCSAEEYTGFLGNVRFEGTRFFEFREDNNLLAVAVVDVLDHGFSAVYTFYAPDAQSRSLGTFAVLWQIQEAQRRGLGWVYLGFWVKECRKMAYKSGFRPLECLVGREWIRFAWESSLLSP
jgi:arginine-tRNA-protein transferase